MIENTIFAGKNILYNDAKLVSGEIILIENEEYYKISNYDMMPPFLMSIISDSDLWMFISSNGALTAGRKNPDQALFPYYTDDRIHDSHDVTGSKTIIFIAKEKESFLWEPFSSRYRGMYNIRRSLYKNKSGNKLIFEEVNNDLQVVFKYKWMNSDRFGFVKKSTVINNNSATVLIKILDGIQNVLPFGAYRKFQLEYSTLLDGYKKNELIEETGLGLYTLSSIPTDKAEPSEALKANIVWSTGLEKPLILLSSNQLDSFRDGNPIILENSVKATRGAYFLQKDIFLQPSDKKEWYIVADLNKTQPDVASLSSFLLWNHDIKQQIENEILNSSVKLNLKTVQADASQLTNDPLTTMRHNANVTFNIMRGGIIDNNYKIDKFDFSKFIRTSNKHLFEKYSNHLSSLSEKINIQKLIEGNELLNDPDLTKLSYEYLPITFSRRHGDPSRPWNLFSIDIKNELGEKVLNYQGNWRDIFQNWEALAYSYPGFIENMIVKFVNASTADGYNPYRVTRDGFDWEKLDPTDIWSYIGYWGDHQIIYLLKFLELSVKFHPGILQSFLTKEIFAYANVPYKIKSYKNITENPHSTIDFDFNLDSVISKKVDEIGCDGKYLFAPDGNIYHVNLTEKLLLSILVKLSNFIPEAGIWMNTQRPEWNDANNALVGYGTSMVTLYYLRRFISFIVKIINDAKSELINVSSEVNEFYQNINNALFGSRILLSERINDDNRKKIIDKLGAAGSAYREILYSRGFSGSKKNIPVTELTSFLGLALDFIDHSIRFNKRNDHLFHSYNLIKIQNDEISVRHLYEMLEGQVAILNSGYLSFEDSIELISALRKSRLYRYDQSSYMLYPERQLKSFMDKNIIPEELLKKSTLLNTLIQKNDKRIVEIDVNGKAHFNSEFRNASYLKKSLAALGNIYELSKEEEMLILDIYEKVFDHQSFTGRSGTFYKYEGLGSIYWHMVSKLLLAVQDVFIEARSNGASDSVLTRLKDYYREIKKGIGSHKQPELYGAIPTDPYSHSPSNAGAQQPGMTGQVKEDIISRFGELGLSIRDGKITFIPSLLSKNEFLNRSQVFKYYDVNCEQQSLMLSEGMLAYTFCQVPIIYILTNKEKIIYSRHDNSEEEIDGFEIGESISKMIFQREGKIAKIKVLINK